ncbi:PIN domain-containing protein [Candidatus Woesearchaeota archaeon]|nr:PIN domain-containing protein [Candidatus Woesearchaeota archaeon]
MKLVVDSNVFFSALIKDSASRKIIQEKKHTLFLPYYFFVEFLKYSNALKEKSKLSEKEFDILVSDLLDCFIIVQKESLFLCKNEAEHIVKDIDPDDTLFIACCLAKEASLWSDDKALKKQGKIKVISTPELLKTTK